MPNVPVLYPSTRTCRCQLNLYKAIRRNNDRYRLLLRQPRSTLDEVPQINLTLGAYRTHFRQYQKLPPIDPLQASWSNICSVRGGLGGFPPSLFLRW